jgi:hypothetical protein
MITISHLCKKVVLVVVTAGLIALIGCNSRPAGKAFASVDQLPAIAELPNPFVFDDGSQMKTAADWPKRRQEIFEKVMYYEYGRMPAAPGNVEGEEVFSAKNADLNASEKTIRLAMGPGHKIVFGVLLTIPNGKGPFPVIIDGDGCWGRIKEPIRKLVIERGYILAEFDRTQITLDAKGPRNGAQLVYPEYDWSALCSWAWGYHRVVDYLEKQSYVDAKKIAVTGHSRGGKTTLVAGATDERIALTAPNDSGCGGCGCYRYQAQKSEDIVAITKNFPHWFSPRFPEFIGKIDRLPFDQHSVKALVAPRALLETEALGDLWANPEGSQVTYSAAKEVYTFLGAENRIGIVYREGKHEHTLGDWTALLDFADQQLKGLKVDRKFDQLAFPNAPKPWSWSAK